MTASLQQAAGAEPAKPRAPTSPVATPGIARETIGGRSAPDPLPVLRAGAAPLCGLKQNAVGARRER